jgi:hypothetical protein
MPIIGPQIMIPEHRECAQRRFATRQCIGNRGHRFGSIRNKIAAQQKDIGPPIDEFVPQRRKHLGMRRWSCVKIRGESDAPI